MKRWTAIVAVVMLMVTLVPSVTAYTTASPLDYSLVTYADRVKLLGDACFTDEGVSLKRPLDGVAFYAEGDTAIETAVRGNGVLSVFVDARYLGDVTVCDGTIAKMEQIPGGMHRVELVYGGGDMTLESITLASSLSAVPATPRVIVFDTAAFTVPQMIQTAHSVGMDCRLSTEETDEAADIVVTDRAYTAQLETQYPRARVVSVGETNDGFTYACEPQAEVLAAYLKSTAVPEEYFKDIVTYVDHAEQLLSMYPPTKENASKLKLETAIARDNDNVSGVLFSLYGQVKDGPRAAVDPPDPEPRLINTFKLKMVLLGVGIPALLIWALVMVSRKPKEPEKKEDIKEESE